MRRSQKLSESLSGPLKHGHGHPDTTRPDTIAPRPTAVVMRLARFTTGRSLDRRRGLWQTFFAAGRETAGRHKARAADSGQPTSEAEHLTVLCLFVFSGPCPCRLSGRLQLSKCLCPSSPGKER